MTILITGVTGFVGGRVLKRFSRLRGVGHDVRLVATARRIDPGPEVLERADRYVSADLARGCPAVDADVCIHAAGLADDRSTDAELEGANVIATRNVLDAVRGCRLFIFVSSASVYGLKAGPLDEDDAAPGAIRSAYGRSKWAAEHIVRTGCGRGGIAHVILRPRAIYGPGDRVLLPRLRRLMRPPWLLTVGDGRVSMSLTYIDHLTAVIESVVLRHGATGTFNIADDAVYELRQVLTALYAALHGGQPRVVPVPVPLVSSSLRVLEALRVKAPLSRQSLDYLVHDCVLSCTRARNVLGYAPATTFFDHASTLATACDSQPLVSQPL